ncbi:hypothetical protein BA953_17165 [Vibrio coralliilyticus]|nr:hypothetical protein BA953_17165 [Vibrio coralliilyticus]
MKKHKVHGALSSPPKRSSPISLNQEALDEINESKANAELGRKIRRTPYKSVKRANQINQ